MAAASSGSHDAGMDNTHPVALQAPHGAFGAGGPRGSNGSYDHPGQVGHAGLSGSAGPASQARQNQLLAGLPDAEWQRWLPLLERVELTCGQVLNEAGSMPQHMLFPTTAVVSLVYLTMDGGCAEVAVVGNDGAVGISLIMGGNTSPSQAVVQCSGQAYRLHAQLVRDEVQRGGPALLVLLRYTQSLMAQVAQTALCNRFHTIDQQLCRRLLLGLDRQTGAALDLTQEAVANLLGVRREGVTAAACKLQKAGVIRYHRGRIEVLDRPRLEQRTCECYAVAHGARARALPLLPTMGQAPSGRTQAGMAHAGKPVPAPTPQPLWQRWPQAYAA